MNKTTYRYLTALFLIGTLIPRLSAQFWQEDSSFTSPILEYPQTDIASVFPLTDGSIIIETVGSFANGKPIGRLAHIKIDGAIDDNFSLPPTIIAAHVVCAYPDSRLLINALLPDSQGWVLLRILANGVIDASFTKSSIGGENTFGVTLQADNKILAWSGGSTTIADGQQMVRLNANGTADSTFAAPPAVLTTIYDVTLQTDGKILLAGGFFLPGTSATRHFLRLNVDGSLDRTFSNELDNSTVSLGYWIQQQPNGRILVNAGLQGGGYIVRRINTDGTIDSSYVPALPDYPALSHVSKPIQGRLYFTQYAGGITDLHRLNADGSLDLSFLYSGQNGTGWTPTLPVSWDGTLLYFGPLTFARYQNRSSITQTDANGVINPNFSPRLSEVAPVDTFTRLANGKYLVAGYFDYINNHIVSLDSVVRLNSDGTLDSSFTIQPPRRNKTITTIKALNDGHIMARDSDNIIRLNADGTLVTTMPFTLGNDVVFDSLGNFYTIPIDTQNGTVFIQRFHADATRDLTFSAPASIHPNRIFPTGEGKLYIEQLGSRQLIRLQSNGAVDSTFTPLDAPDYADTRDYCVLPDNSILTVDRWYYSSNGGATRYATYTHYNISGVATYVYDGTLDTPTIAGALLDMINVTSPLGGNAVIEASYTKQIVDVQSNGQATVLTSGTLPFNRFSRINPISPSIPTGPAIIQQPKSVVGNIGETINFEVFPIGLNPFSYQWLKNGTPIPGATDYALRLNSIGVSDAANYTVKITNSAGSVISAVAALTIHAPPTVSTQPNNATTNVGGSATFTVGTTVSGVTYQWQIRLAGTTAWINLIDGSGYSGSKTGQLMVNPVTAPMNGDSFQCILSNDLGQIASSPATLSVAAAASAKLVNISTRSYVGTGGDVMIAGFIIGGTGPKTLLIRASGPALGKFGVPGVLADPVLELHDSTSIISTNDNWSDDAVKKAAIVSAAQSVGAFTWDDGSKDAALVVTLNPGLYTAIVSGKNDGTGAALVEAYEIDTANNSSKLVNISTRSLVKTDDNVQIAGFIIGGTTPKKVIIRASGPALTKYGVSGVLADPVMELHTATDVIATNDNWDAALRPDFQKVGIDNWQVGSNDAALVVTLNPGPYTAVIYGKNKTTGVALMEVFEENE